MAPLQVVEDYYAILEVTEAADKTTIKASYRRLARQQHPDKNPGNPHATAQFQLLNIAHATLVDDTKRHEYNTFYYPAIRSQRQWNKWGDHKGHHTGGQGTTHVRPTAATSASTSTYYRTHIAALERKLQDTGNERAALDRDISSITRALHQIEATLKRIDEEEADDKRDEQERIKNTTGLYGYFFGQRETLAEANVREGRAVLRKHVRLVQRREMETHQSKLDTKRINLTTVVKQRALLQQKIDEARTQEAKLQQKEKERERAQQQQQQQQRERQRKADEARKMQREADEAKKKMAAQDAADERWRRRQQEASEKKQAHEVSDERWQMHRDAANKIFAAREERARWEAEATETANVSKATAADASATDAQAAKMAEDSSGGVKHEINKGTKTTEGEKKLKKSSDQSAQTSWKKTTSAQHHQHSPSPVCQHQRWWSRVEGRQKCQRCHTMTARFAFQCPDCQTIACADCRTTMKVPTVPTAPTGLRSGGTGKDGRGGVSGHGRCQGSGREAGRRRGRGRGG